MSFSAIIAGGFTAIVTTYGIEACREILMLRKVLECC